MTTRAELEFLPAALEIQDTPPLPLARYILWTIALFFLIAVFWASVGKVDIVGVARGKIVPSGRVKIIQPLETGVVRRIFVEEGDRVAADQPLIELDTTLAGADREQVREQQLALRLDRARLRTLLELAELPADEATGNDIESRLGQTGFASLLPVESTTEQTRTVKQRLLSQYNEFRSRAAAVADEKRQRAADRGAVAEQISRLDETIPLITERAGSLEELLQKDMVPRMQWLELEQQRIEQVKERDVQRRNLESLEAVIANIGRREATVAAEFRNQLFAELTEVENRLATFEQDLIKTEKRITLQTLASPVAGTVHRLSVHTVGGVVTPAQELMHIVPDDGAAEVEAWIANQDIGFIHSGQPVEIKVETFPFTKYGTVQGELLNVSGDATPDENLGLVYAARVRMDRNTMQVEDKTVNLGPGMAVTVEVKMGQRRVIEYLLSPLLRYQRESIRER